MGPRRNVRRAEAARRRPLRPRPPRRPSMGADRRLDFLFFFKQKTAYEIGLGIPAEPLFRSFTFYVPHRHVYGEQWIKFMKDGVNATPLPTVNTTGYVDHAAFLGTINPDTNKIPKHLFQGYLNIYNNY